MKMLMVLVALTIHTVMVASGFYDNKYGDAPEGLIISAVIGGIVAAIIIISYLIVATQYVEAMAKVKNANRFIDNAEDRLKNMKALVHNFINDKSLLTEEEQGKTVTELFEARLAEEGLLANGDNPAGSFVGEIGKCMEEINASKNRRDEALETMTEIEMGMASLIANVYSKQATEVKKQAEVE